MTFIKYVLCMFCMYSSQSVAVLIWDLVCACFFVVILSQLWAIWAVVRVIITWLWLLHLCQLFIVGNVAHMHSA